MSRISRDRMFIEVSKLVAERSTCLRAKVGAVLVRDNRIVSMGYVGSPPGMPHCLDEGCQIGEKGGCIRTVHAEENAIQFAMLYGIETEGSTLYCTHSPCVNCARQIIEAEIASVVFLKQYRDETGLRMLINKGITAISLFQLEVGKDERGDGTI